MDVQIIRLHHIGYATKEIGPSTEAYTARFDYEIATGVIHDPLQTAFMQFLHYPGVPIHLEFVAPDGPQSKLAEGAKRGGGLNHLCYTSGSLRTAIAGLEQNGMKLISDPKPAVAFAGRRIC